VLLHRLLPAPLHVAGLRLAHAVRLRWWRLAGSAVRGCRVLVLDREGRVLLIRHSYGSGHWMLPGGGLSAREHPLAGAHRELAEEVAMRLTLSVLLGRTDDPLSIHETHLVAGWSDDLPVPDGREIVAAGFFALHDLPAPLPDTLAGRLPDWVTAAQAARPPG